MTNPALLFARLARRHPLQVIAFVAIAAAALAFGIPRLEFKTGQDTLISASSKVARDNERFQNEFGGDPMLVLFESDADHPITALFSDANRAELARWERDLAASGNYESVLTPLGVVALAQAQIEKRMVEEPARLARDQEAADAAARAESAARGETPEQQDAAAKAARQRGADDFNLRFGADAKRFLSVGEHALSNPAFLEFVLYGPDGALRPELAGIFPDERHALMVVRPKGNLSIDETASLASRMVDESAGYRFESVDVLVSGPPLLIKEINDKMREALAAMAIFAVLIMVTVLFLVFRARWRLLSLSAVLVGAVSAFGLMGFLGVPLTMVTISGLPILIGLGVDFAVQVHSRIEEETLAADSAETGIERAAILVGPALGTAGAAACIGFMVLRISSVPMIRDFGSMLTVGAIVVFGASVALIASIVYLRERVRLGPTTPVRARIEVERLVGGLTARTVGRLLPIAAVAAAVALTGLYVGGKIGTETDPERFVPSDSTVLRDLHRVRDIAGSTSELNVLVATTDGSTILDDAVLAWMIDYEEAQLRAHPELRQSNSVASLAKMMTGNAPGAASAGEALAAAPQALVDTVISPDGTMANITFAISGAETLDQQDELTDAIIDSANAPPQITVAPAGISVVGTETVKALSANRDLMSFVALAAIFAMLFAVYRNPFKAVAPLLPVVLALGASAIMLYATGMKYSPLTSISGPLIIAMGTEFNILLMSRYFEERAAGREPREAMTQASLRIGRSITASGLTVMGGFAVLAFSNFPLLDNFGKVTALNIGVSLMSTLVLLPPLLVWADEDHGLVGAARAVAE